MGKIPKPRNEGHFGGGGYKNHGPSMGRSASRGGRPHGRGGGSGSRPPGKSSGGGSKSMVWMAVAMLGLPLAVLAGVASYLLHGYGVI